MRRLLLLATTIGALVWAAPAAGEVAVQKADVMTTAESIAAPAGAAGASTVVYSGRTSPQDFTDDGIDNGSPEAFSFDFDGTSVNNVMTATSLRCPDGSYMNMGTHRGLPGEPFPVTNGHFDATIGDPNQGHGLTWHVVGKIANGRASGTVEVQAHEYSGVGPSGPICTSSFTWTASAPSPSPTRPTPPRVEVTPGAPGSRRPAASLLIVALRSPDRRFFWGTARVRCQNRATHLIVSVRRSRTHVSRRRIGCRRRISLASSAVRPHRMYAIRTRPIRMRSGRVVARGETYRLRLYMPGNEAKWIPVPGLRLP